MADRTCNSVRCVRESGTDHDAGWRWGCRFRYGSINCVTGAPPGTTAADLTDQLVGWAHDLDNADAKWGPKIEAANQDLTRLNPMAPPDGSSGNLSTNRQAAVDFADTYAIGGRMPYVRQDNDCTTFASNVLQAGGFQQDSKPHVQSDTSQRCFEATLAGTPSLAWDNADGLHTYVTNNDGAGNNGPVGREVAAQTMTPNSGDPNALSHTGLKPGDLIFYDWNEGEGTSHTAVYVGKDWCIRPEGWRRRRLPYERYSAQFLGASGRQASRQPGHLLLRTHPLPGRLRMSIVRRSIGIATAVTCTALVIAGCGWYYHYYQQYGVLNWLNDLPRFVHVKGRDYRRGVMATLPHNTCRVGAMRPLLYPIWGLDPDESTYDKPCNTSETTPVGVFLTWKDGSTWSYGLLGAP